MPSARSYVNGDFRVVIRNDGLKIRVGEGLPHLPESIDLKITNHCSGAPCAKWCHERSNPSGQHGDLDFIKDLISQMIRGTEIAIGGGNTASHPYLREIVEHANNCGVIPNITINEFHAENFMDRFSDLEVGGIGLSLSVRPNSDVISRAVSLWGNRLVFHIINTVNHQDTAMWLSKIWDNPILILGYKEWGNGRVRNLSDVRAYQDLYEVILNKSAHVCFDTLGIKDFIKNAPWMIPDGIVKNLQDDPHYMGEEGQFSMYVDAVKKECAISSISSDRVGAQNLTLKDMWDVVRCYKELDKRS